MHAGRRCFIVNTLYQIYLKKCKKNYLAPKGTPFDLKSIGKSVIIIQICFRLPRFRKKILFVSDMEYPNEK